MLRAGTTLNGLGDNSKGIHDKTFWLEKKGMTDDNQGNNRIIVTMAAVTNLEIFKERFNGLL